MKTYIICALLFVCAILSMVNSTEKKMRILAQGDLRMFKNLDAQIANASFKLGIDCGAQAICEAQRDCCEEQLPWAAKWSIDPDSIYRRAAEIRKDPDLVFHLQPGRIIRVTPSK